jgi:hypothetical protein
METLKKVFICSAILVGIVFFAFTYRLHDRFKETNTSNPPYQWLAVTNGETRQQLTQILGAPTGQSISNVDLWQKGNGTLRVTYNENGYATNVSLNGTWGFAVPFKENAHNTNAPLP